MSGAIKRDRKLRAWALRTMRKAERRAKEARRDAEVWSDVARQLRAVAEALRA